MSWMQGSSQIILMTRPDYYFYCAQIYLRWNLWHYGWIKYSIKCIWQYNDKSPLVIVTEVIMIIFRRAQTFRKRLLDVPRKIRQIEHLIKSHQLIKQLEITRRNRHAYMIIPKCVTMGSILMETAAAVFLSVAQCGVYDVAWTEKSPFYKERKCVAWQNSQQFVFLPWRRSIAFSSWRTNVK